MAFEIRAVDIWPQVGGEEISHENRYVNNDMTYDVVDVRSSYVPHVRCRYTMLYVPDVRYRDLSLMSYVRRIISYNTYAIIHDDILSRR